MTPGCSTCGFAVEWLRSCYDSNWRLFRGQPAVVTPGSYVFAPPGIPHYPGWHNLGSRNWTSDERTPAPELGEVDGGRQVYGLGIAPLPYPPAGLLGDADCITNGERYPLPVITRNFDRGWDSRCFDLPRPPLPVPARQWDIFDCHDRRELITQLGQLEALNGAGAVAALNAYMPGWTWVFVNDGPGPIPGSIIGTRGTSTIVMVAGTSNATQWTYQITSGLLGPVDFGWFSTLQFWHDASDAIIDRMNAAGASGAGRLVLVGHSYGAALCCIIAARCRVPNASRPIQLLTCGCPKPGDTRLVELLDTIQQLHYVNSDDPIPYLPPGVQELGYVGVLVPAALRARWSVWRVPGNRVGLTPEGQVYDNPDSAGLVSIIYRTVQRLLLGLEPPAATAHGIVEYTRRLLCPDDPPPGKTPADPFRDVVCWLRPEYLQSAYALGDEVTLWGDDGPFGFDGKEGPLPGGVHVALDGAPLPVAAEFKRIGGMQFPLLDLGNTHSCYLVATFRRPMDVQPLGVRMFCQGGFLLDLRFLTAQMAYSSAFTTVAGSIGLAPGLRVFSVRRRPNFVELRVNGIVLASGPADPTGNLKLTGFQLLGLQLPTTKRSWVAELLIFGKEVDDDQQTALYSYFTSRYGVP